MNNIAHYNDFINSFSKTLLKTFKTDYLYDISEGNILDKVKHIGTDSLAKALEMIDHEFFISINRSISYKVKQIRQRTIDTLLGPVTFKRRQYQSKKDGKYFYYVDELILNLARYQRLSNELIASLLHDVASDSYQTCANRYNLSKTSVYNLVSKFSDINFNLVESQDEPISIDTLYVQADECFVPLQDERINGRSQKILIEQVTIHQGIKNVCKGRNKLKNKLLLTRYNNEEKTAFYERVNDTIMKLYNTKDIYFYGDGAAWINTCCDTVGATRILDLFHAHQAINRITKANKADNTFLAFMALKQDKKAFFEFINNNYKSSDNWSEVQERSCKYLKNNWRNFMQNYILSNSIGCSQEGINFHYFAKRLTTIPKGFSRKNARTIALLSCAKNNLKDFKLSIYKAVVKKNKTYDYDNEATSKGSVIKQSYMPIRQAGGSFAKILNSISS